jgi:hypothetical protein
MLLMVGLTANVPVVGHAANALSALASANPAAPAAVILRKSRLCFCMNRSFSWGVNRRTTDRFRDSLPALSWLSGSWGPARQSCSWLNANSRSKRSHSSVQDSAEQLILIPAQENQTRSAR